MCGIVGYIGSRDAASVVVGGLRRLEYRGYDSAGIAVLYENGDISVERAVGKLRNLGKTEALLFGMSGRSRSGIRDGLRTAV